MTFKMASLSTLPKTLRATLLLVSIAESVDFASNCCIRGPQVEEALMKELLLQFAILNYKTGQESMENSTISQNLSFIVVF